MTRRHCFAIGAMIGFLALWPEAAGAQCAMCRRALASPEGQQMIAAFRSGIAVLLVAPFVVFGAVAGLAIRDQKRRNVPAAREAGPAHSAGPGRLAIGPRASRVGSFLVCLLVAAATSACRKPSPEHGQVLVTAGGCHDCHTTKKPGPKGPEPDMSRMLAGHPENIAIVSAYKPVDGSPWTIATTETLTAWSGPWGVSFAANLTPDRNTGLRSGVWTEDLFVKALKTGRHMGVSREILPPMPWSWYAQLSEADLRDIWAYLQTIPPVQNHVPDPLPPAVAP